MNTSIDSARTGTPVLLLDYEGAATTLSLSRAALRDLVYKGRGPRTTKIGRRTFFAVKDLEAFIDSHREPALQTPTSVVERPRKRGRPTIAEQMAAGRTSHRT